MPPKVRISFIESSKADANGNYRKIIKHESKLYYFNKFNVGQTRAYWLCTTNKTTGCTGRVITDHDPSTGMFYNPVASSEHIDACTIDESVIRKRELSQEIISRTQVPDASGKRLTTSQAIATVTRRTMLEEPGNDFNYIRHLQYFALNIMFKNNSLRYIGTAKKFYVISC